MKAPNFPSFFKNQDYKKFKFLARYYKTPSISESLSKKGEKKIKFKISNNNESIKGRNKRIIFIIIVLSLLTHYFLK
mgnify:CR=1 FL=1|tara:strand:+ start:418 stop:648 length:231 start_codon:yes stop_codon:yes gene_type:complete